MRHWLIGFVLFFLLILGYTYIFIPGRIRISNDVFVNANQQSTFRYLADSRNWAKWWPGLILGSSTNTSIFRYRNQDFQIKQFLHNTVDINLENGNQPTRSILQIFSYSVDTIKLEWSTELIAGANPFKRVLQYFTAKKIDRNFRNILGVLKTHLSSLKNLYGIDIKKEKVQFQHLISTKQSFFSNPTTSDIYAMVEKLRNHLKNAGQQPESFPMLNIRTTDSVKYLAQVALPVDKEIPENENISLKWMLKGGNILSAEVIGGNRTIEDSMKQFEKYISDYQRTIIAIPFQLLVTDRLKEPDSTKWITRLYYPVI